ncbi:hypothetical protein G6F64_002566 [Rhizopus arrhizus]|uniref:Reverse transcriptase domain-containing protein n=1 Tax=Rhizopus oryzae TaxID=64495 RepID=A0A9P6XGA1_RHIOR|nr:hypothetical protein G6F64_002566 [Rhizopus arrhizus]
MEQAHVQKRPEIGLLLDQEMAYDRVHPLYLRQTMLAFGFSPSLVHSLESLFFGNAVRIDINGYFTNRIYQRRDLRQGNPLSPLLFNIALEQFLRHKLQGSFKVPIPSREQLGHHNIQYHASSLKDRYGSVSNAKVNIHKTEAFSLDGRSYPEWIAFLAAQGISKWHDHSSPSPLRYLGFPLIQSFHQRRYLEQQLLQTVKSQCTIYSQHYWISKTCTQWSAQDFCHYLLQENPSFSKRSAMSLFSEDLDAVRVQLAHNKLISSRVKALVKQLSKKDELLNQFWAEYSTTVKTISLKRKHNVFVTGCLLEEEAIETLQQQAAIKKSLGEELDNSRQTEDDDAPQ